jgi:hypothetical protein
MGARRTRATGNDEREKVVLPIWHDVDVGDVANHSLPLAGRRAAQTRDGLDAVVAEIEAVFAAANTQTATEPERSQPVARLAVAPEPFLVLAPPSTHRLDEPHRVTPPPQVLWAQTAFVNVENVGSATAIISSAGADATGVGTITVRPPTAIAPGTARPVELVVNTMTPDVRIPAGQQLPFWLDYGNGERVDRRLWAVAQFFAGGGWSNLGSENRSLVEPEEKLIPAAGAVAPEPAIEQALARIAFPSSEVRGERAHLRLRRWLGSQRQEPMVCRVDGHLGQFEAVIPPRSAGGGWVEYDATFPQDFEEAGVSAGSHAVSWRATSPDEELAADEFRFP